MKMRWPDREEWARRMRTPYADLMPSPSDAIADYATAEEITDLRTAMRERWKALGIQMRAEGGGDGFRGGDNAKDLWQTRKAINRGLKQIERGILPMCLDDHGCKDLLAPFHARWQDAKDRMNATKAQEIAARPIDDAAWAAELKRRERIEAGEAA